MFFMQQWVGHKNKLFKIWKFITMVSNAQHALDGTVTGKNDMRITPIGRFLRNSKIDEFPQFLNILNGDRSLVGSRTLLQKPDSIPHHQHKKSQIIPILP
ncbi:MAG: sugar transferase [Saprospiraceae bacterium]